MEKEKTIYDLELHETLKIANDMYVYKVPGGWIYQIICDDEVSCVFVPYGQEYRVN
jgi:hypothetical protein